MSIGAIAVPLNPSYSVDKMAYVLDDASPVLVVTDRATGGERLEELRRAGGCLVLEDLTKMGASGSLLIAMMVLEVCMPARCCIAPEIPTGDVQLRADGLAGLPDLELVRVPAGGGGGRGGPRPPPPPPGGWRGGAGRGDGWGIRMMLRWRGYLPPR
jgi:hypothetical protein